MKLNYLIFLMLTSVLGYGQISVIVNKGTFKTVKEAAFGEGKINFFDDNYASHASVTESYAALELATFLSKIRDIPVEEIKFADPDQIPKKGDVFILGSKESNTLTLSKPSKIGYEFDSDQAFSIRAYTEGNRAITIIEGSGRVGTLYGVYSYLEQLGIRFIGLGDDGITYPKKIEAVPSNIDRFENPSYLTRGYWVNSEGKVKNALNYYTWMARNKMNFWTNSKEYNPLLKKLGIKLTDGGHGTQIAFLGADKEYQYNHPKFEGDEDKESGPYGLSNEYLGDENKNGILSNFEAHPEWYGLIDGKRLKNKGEFGGSNFCTSNDGAKKELAKNLVQSLINGNWKYVDVVNLWMADGGKWCTCDRCLEDGTETDRLFDVVHEILNEIKRARDKKILNRSVEVTTVAYHETLSPPTKPLPVDFDYENASVTFFPIGRCYAHAFGDTACPEINEHQAELFKNWASGSNYKGDLFIGEYYNVSSLKSMPTVFSRIMATDIPWYHRRGARHFHYMHPPTDLWGTWKLNQYFLTKALWNVNLDSTELLDDFYSTSYPTTKTTTRLFYNELEKASSNLKVIKHYVKLSSGKTFRLENNFLGGGDLFLPEHLSYEPSEKTINRAASIVETMEAMDKAEVYLEQSLISCSNGSEKVRIMADKKIFEYGYAMIRYIYHMVRTSMFYKLHNYESAKIEFASVKKYKEKLEKVIDLVQTVPNDIVIEKNGFYATQSVEKYDEFNNLYVSESIDEIITKIFETSPPGI